MPMARPAMVSVIHVEGEPISAKASAESSSGRR